MNALCCPNCRRADRVRKVSAIIAEGERYTTTITDHRRSTSISEGVTTTALAARLAPPAPPRSSGCALLAGSAVAVVVGCAQLSSDGPQKNTKRTKDRRNPPTVHTFCALCVLLWQTYVRNIVMYNCSTIGYRLSVYRLFKRAPGAQRAFVAHERGRAALGDAVLLRPLRRRVCAGGCRAGAGDADAGCAWGRVGGGYCPVNISEVVYCSRVARYRSSGVRPVRLAMRASMRGPISSSS
jgi:hypothetical protein